MKNHHRRLRPPSLTRIAAGAALITSIIAVTTIATDFATAADTEQRIVWSGVSPWTNIGSESKSVAKCDRDTLMIGRSHDGGASGPSGVRCTGMSIPGWSGPIIRTGATSTSPWITESDGTAFSCPGEQVMSLRFHVNGADGDTQYRCQALEMVRRGDDRVRPVTVKNPTWSASVRESGSRFSCPVNTAMVGRQHTGNENGDTRYRCAELTVTTGGR